ncbi:MAG: Asp-tRNA(Asn)/Glu-tRNA(Gln) amidotransferase subunit GatC [Proteobacteria bacterium]|jgi:aspartyl-tRNA(Asn)/glutamyl-tRNA(Gln) amidotransferase subunit C|nr:Asp-tRNA(Asn)/Glu-tRNA(Gln) amidotransferase subunit GatC [Alphaproteobacteria bacterium]NCC03656.1 Asp-tRNA(Asn)/Glu-tRNA(Gln) amidotransferase subunit GatC [Pseudomonadota bacterium]
MSIDIETAKKIASLARLKIPEAEEQQVATDLSRILEWVGQLDELDVAGVEPLANVNDNTLGWREVDEVTDGNQPEAVLANAPSKTADFFTVPKVVE